MSHTVNDQTYDVVAIGNAILDILSFTEDAFIESQGLTKGTMTLIDQERASELYDHMSQAEEVSGGSAANTLAGMASLGSRTAFIGKVRDDQLGKIYRHDLKAVGVDFDTPAATEGAPTGCCYILVTPDGERTMNTYLGAGSEIFESDIDEQLVAKAKVLYGEGYQWSVDHNKDALRKAFAATKASGGKVAFTLSDLFCVQNHRDDFVQLLDDTFDILFANEMEISAMYPGKNFDEIVEHVRGKAEVIAITRSEKGSVIVTKDNTIEVPAAPIEKLVDTTGAGDLYAAGFLHGYCQGKDLRSCGELGSACAAEIIQHMGARSMKPLKELVA